MKVLITGAGGYSGFHLAKLLAGQPGSELFLTARTADAGRNILGCDLTQGEPVENLLTEIKPDRIYHLAGSFTNDYALDHSANVLAAKNIFDAVLKTSAQCRILLVGSAAEYGPVRAGDNPVQENHPLRPVKISGLTKVFQTYLMNFYVKVHRLDVVMARAFNLYGDGRRVSKRLFIGRVYEQIDQFKKGEAARIMVGDLEARRDYIDIGEAVMHYQKILERGKTGEVYNVGSGRSIPMRIILSKILREEGLSESIVEEVKPNLPVGIDVPDIFADISKLKGL